MLLSDRDLRAELDTGRLRVTPGVPDWAIQPASIDLSLSPYFRLFSGPGPDGTVDPGRQEELTEAFTSHAGDPFVLQPGEFVLGSTGEEIGVSVGLAAKLEGRSSLGRLGLMVHVTAGWIDPGFRGHVTLELSNVAGRAVRLTPGMAIAQLCVFRLSSPALRPYGTPGLGSKYQDQSGPTPSRAWMDEVGAADVVA